MADESSCLCLCLCLTHAGSHLWNKHKHKEWKSFLFLCLCLCLFQAYFMPVPTRLFLCLCLCLSHKWEPGFRVVVKTTTDTWTGPTKPQNRWWSLPSTPLLIVKRWYLSCISTPLSSSKKWQWHSNLTFLVYLAMLTLANWIFLCQLKF